MRINKRGAVITAVMSTKEAGIIARALARLSERWEPGSYVLFEAFHGKLTEKQYDYAKIHRQNEATP